MIRPEIMQALAGGGLTAQDYAGLTPEQIQAVAGHGQHDRNALFGVVQNMQQAEMQTRKQDFDEMHQNRTFQLMQDQERRAQFQTLVDMGFKAAAHQLDQRRLQLENMRTRSAMNVDEAQRKKLDLEIEDIRKQRERVSMLDDTYIEVPIKDKDGKPTSTMSLGALFAGGSEFANTAFKFAVAKNLGGTGFDGSSGIPGLGGGSGESNAEQVRAIKRQMFLDQGLDPKAAHIMSTMDGVLTTPEKVFDQFKNDKLITTMPPDQLKAFIEDTVYKYNDWIYKTYTGKNQAEWKSAARTVQEQTGGGTTNSSSSSTGMTMDSLSPEQRIEAANKIDAALDASTKKMMEEKYPEWFQYSETYGRKTLKPNVVNLIAKEISGRAGTFVDDAAMDINQFLLELMQKDPLANRMTENKERAAHMKNVVNR